jgi:hypothetical protein
MCGTYRTHREMENASEMFFRIPEVNRLIGKPGVDGKIILKCILNKEEP